MFQEARQARTLIRPGQNHQAEADAVESQVVLDVEVGNPGAPDDQVVLVRLDSSVTV